MTARPNILVLMVDQFNGTLFPDGPADFLHAPHLKRSRHVRAFRQRLYGKPSARRRVPPSCPGNCPAAHASMTIAANSPPTSRPSPIICARRRYRQAFPARCISSDRISCTVRGALTTDIYPADFGWTPDYRKPGERIDWCITNSAPSRARALPRSPIRWSTMTSRL